ncbi:MAG: AmmeMemoRadiSam system protein A [Bacillota bacterium]|nr:AmmeMemoRadiSam system protein A [Bacillota bacterium]
MSQVSLLAGYIMPHPPVIVPGVNSSQMKAAQTIQAMKLLSSRLAALKPDTVVLITPHAPLFSDYLFIYDDTDLCGNLAAFGAPEINLTLQQDQQFQERFLQDCKSININAGSLNANQLSRFNMDCALDHGAIVPLYFLSQTATFQLVVMASAALPIPDLYAVGRQIRLTAEALGRRIIIVASGDQSHKANAESPYGSCPEGAEYDRLLVSALDQSDRTAILSINPQLRQRAAECGYRSIVMLCGAYSDLAIRSSVLSYEAPYGIGYCVAEMNEDPAGLKPLVDPLQVAMVHQQKAVIAHMQTESAPVQIVRETLSQKIKRNKVPQPDYFRDLTDREPWLLDQAGVFVSLKKHGELRGCIGTTAPTTESIVAEIIQNAISAATRDPRFNSVTTDELQELTISVDVLGTPVPVTSRTDLDPGIYGVIVRSGHLTGLLLPDLDGVDTVEEQLAIACRKAGIRPDDPYDIERFRVTRYT